MARIASSHETSSRLTIATYSRSRPSSVSSSMPEGCGHHGVVEAPDGQDWACSPPQKYPDRCLSLSQSLKDDTRSCLMAGRQARRSRTQSGGFVSFRDAHDGPVRGRRRGDEEVSFVVTVRRTVRAPTSHMTGYTTPRHREATTRGIPPTDAARWLLSFCGLEVLAVAGAACPERRCKSGGLAGLICCWCQ